MSDCLKDRDAGGHQVDAEPADHKGIELFFMLLIVVLGIGLVLSAFVALVFGLAKGLKKRLPSTTLGLVTVLFGSGILLLLSAVLLRGKGAHGHGIHVGPAPGIASVTCLTMVG